VLSGLRTRTGRCAIAVALTCFVLAGSGGGEARRGQRPAGQPLSHPALPAPATPPTGQAPAADGQVPSQGSWGEKIEPVEDKTRPASAPGPRRPATPSA
jgi:hypothetical protein